MVQELLDLPYTDAKSDPERTLDLFLPSSPEGSQLLVFVHGGAWRSGNKSNHVALARSLASRGISVAVPNYRLSTRAQGATEVNVIHPTHTNDVLDSLRFLSKRGDILWKNVTLVGHSVGAWFVLAAMSRSSGMPSLEPSITNGVSQLVLVDGIYDISHMLKEYPDYASFVNQAFLPSTSTPTPGYYDQFSLPAWTLVRKDLAVHLLHSKDDQLLSFKQTLDAAIELDSRFDADAPKKTVKIPTQGAAAVSTEKKLLLADQYPDFGVRNVHVDLDTLSEKHDELLATQVFWDMLDQIARH